MNMKSAALAAFATLALAAFGPQAMAADNGFYLGAGISQSNTELELAGFGSDDVDDTGFKVIGGWRPLDWLAVEANYIDLGGDSEEGTSIDSSAITRLGAGARGNRHRRPVRARRHGQLGHRILRSGRECFG